jgi:hypothetical protein
MQGRSQGAAGEQGGGNGGGYAGGTERNRLVSLIFIGLAPWLSVACTPRRRRYGAAPRVRG